LVVAKNKKIITELRPLFKKFLANNRYYSLELLNKILKSENENPL